MWTWRVRRAIRISSRCFSTSTKPLLRTCSRRSRGWRHRVGGRISHKVGAANPSETRWSTSPIKAGRSGLFETETNGCSISRNLTGSDPSTSRSSPTQSPGRKIGQARFRIHFPSRSLGKSRGENRFPQLWLGSPRLKTRKVCSKRCNSNDRGACFPSARASRRSGHFSPHPNSHPRE